MSSSLLIHVKKRKNIFDNTKKYDKIQIKMSIKSKSIDDLN